MNAVTVESEAIDVDALVIAAVASGEWREERAMLLGAAAAEDAGERLDAEELSAREEEFRRGKGLWAAEDLTAWLTARDVTVGEWRAHLRRRLLAERGLHDRGAAFPQPLPEHIEAAWVALLLDGVLASCADRLEQGAGAAHLLGERAPADNESIEATDALTRAASEDALLPLESREPRTIAAAARQVVRLSASRRRLLEQITEEEIGATVAEHGADWTTLEFDGLSLSTEGQGREAVMCVRDDGLALAAVAEMIGAEASRTRALAETMPSFARHLLGARPGQVLGPIHSGGRFEVIVLRARRAPDATDPTIAARASESIANARISRRIAGRVRRHVEL